MFHAQMRLSLEGCRKLAGFLSGTARVRALSLSHNFLGARDASVLAPAAACLQPLLALRSAQTRSAGPARSPLLPPHAHARVEWPPPS